MVIFLFFEIENSKIIYNKNATVFGRRFLKLPLLIKSAALWSNMSDHINNLFNLVV